MKRIFAVPTIVLLVLLSMTAMAATGRYDQQIQQAVSRKIQENRQFQKVNSSVEDGIVTLAGSVDLYQNKLDAGKKAKNIANVTGVRNNIVVAGANVPDSQLQQKLTKQLAFDRVGYFDNAFNYIAVNVKDGVVTLTGATYWDVPRDSAMSIIARTPGVKDVVNEVKVLPTSIFDDTIRRQEAHAIYRDSVLSRYATDPKDPIRIVVANGHVTLYGSVQNTMDKNLAGIRASEVPGVFSVQNNLVVNSRG